MAARPQAKALKYIFFLQQQARTRTIVSAIVLHTLVIIILKKRKAYELMVGVLKIYLLDI
jgi:hypothetical protein